KQAIYAFRGADVFTYIAAKADARGSEYTLQTNWRSSPRLIRGINALFNHATAQFVMPEIPFRSMQSPANATEALGGAAALQFLFVRSPAGAGPITKGASKEELPD